MSHQNLPSNSPALYYMHEYEPTFVGRSVIRNAYIVQSHFAKHDQLIYVIIVDNGKAFAARRNFVRSGGETRRVIECVDISNDITGKQILLKHTLLFN